MLESDDESADEAESERALATEAAEEERPTPNGIAHEIAPNSAQAAGEVVEQQEEVVEPREVESREAAPEEAVEETEETKAEEEERLRREAERRAETRKMNDKKKRRKQAKRLAGVLSPPTKPETTLNGLRIDVASPTSPSKEDEDDEDEEGDGDDESELFSPASANARAVDAVSPLSLGQDTLPLAAVTEEPPLVPTSLSALPSSAAEAAPFMPGEGSTSPSFADTMPTYVEEEAVDSDGGDGEAASSTAQQQQYQWHQQQQQHPAAYGYVSPPLHGSYASAQWYDQNATLPAEYWQPRQRSRASSAHGTASPPLNSSGAHPFYASVYRASRARSSSFVYFADPLSYSSHSARIRGQWRAAVHDEWTRARSHDPRAERACIRGARAHERRRHEHGLLDRDGASLAHVELFLNDSDVAQPHRARCASGHYCWSARSWTTTTCTADGSSSSDVDRPSRVV